MKFQAKLFLFFALTVVLPICVATAVISVYFSRLGEETTTDRLRSASGLVKARMQTPNDILAAELSSKLVNQPSLITASLDSNPIEAIPALDALAAELGASQMSLSTAAGISVAQAGSSAGDGRCLAGVNIPINQGGPVIGWVMATREIDADFLRSVLTDSGFPSSVSCGGQLAASTFPGGAVPPAGSLSATDPSQQTATTADVGNESYFLLDYTFANQSSFTPPVVFTLGTPTADVESRQTIIIESGLSLVAFTLLIAALLGYLTTKSITNPLRLLTGAVLRAEAGNLDCGVDVHSRDEIGILARNFNRMCRQISRFIKDLQQAHRRLLQAFGYAGDLLVSGYDREKLIKSVTGTAALATSAVATAFYLYEDIDGRRRLGPARTAPAEFFTDLRTQAIEATISGVETGVIKGLVSHQLDEDYIFMVAPVVLQEHTFGALVAVIKRETITDESSSRILGSLANQAATALENVRLSETLQQMVITDSLTGLFNVRYFNESLKNQIEIAQRYKTNLSLLIVDLDNFKQVNDTYGHMVGDEVLRRVGSLFAESVRRTDIAARYGGEEFAIILPHTAKDTALEVAQKLLRKVRLLRLPEYPGLGVSFSIGVASYPMDGDDPGKLLRTADDATYKAKEQGKDRAVSA